MVESESFSLELRGIDVRFGGVRAVENVSFSVPVGRIRGIIGPNGSGKTTLLNAISGFVVASGSVRVYGREIRHLRTDRRVSAGLGRSFQNPRMDSEMRIFDVLRLGAHVSMLQPWWQVGFLPHSADRAWQVFVERCRELLNQVGLSDDVLDRRVSEVSAGSMKLIDIARSLMCGPRLLLLDEPTSGMNDSEIASIARLLRTLSKYGMSILLIEHNLRFVREVCETVEVLSNGSLIGEGAIDDVLRQPNVVESYFGSTASQ